MHTQHQHDPSLVILSIVIAIFASYTALDLVNSLSTSKGRARVYWLAGGALAMGVGIWSMHFIGMLAFSIQGLNIFYDLPLLVLSIIVAVMASALALHIVSREEPTVEVYIIGSLVMGTAIAGMHYIGIASMILAARFSWNWNLVIASILIAFAASFGALLIGFKLRSDISVRGFIYRGIGGIIMGFAIAGMHYTAMAAMDFILDPDFVLPNQFLLATDGLASAVIIATLVILGIALTGSNMDRALSRRLFMNEVLQEGIRSRDEFLSIASHELKTPLTSMKLQVQFILKRLTDETFSSDQAQDYMAKLHKNLNRIDRLVNDMLDISRISAGKLSMNIEETNLSLLIDEVVERFRPIIRANSQNDIYLENTEVKGKFDAFRIDQVLSNLITNAIKYAKGSDVRIEVKRESKKVLIIVRDKGPGIPEDSLSKIFERFERANMGRDISGLGLGLFISKEIVEAHQGSIRVESSSETGTAFFVELPIT